MKAKTLASDLLILAQRYGVNGAHEPFTKRCIETMVRESEMTSKAFVFVSEAIATSLSSHSIKPDKAQEQQ